MIQQRSAPEDQSSGLRSAPNFRSWQRSTIENGLLPVVAVTGGRGKSTVVRMVDAILEQAILRTATWTNLGVELRGRRQRGEIGGWSLALSRLAESSLDVALQEMHWSTINAVGLPPSSYPVIALTNLTGRTESHAEPNSHSDSFRGALRAAAAAHHLGTVIASADDPGLYDAARTTTAQLVVTSLAKESPILRHQLAVGGHAVWVENDQIHGGNAGGSIAFCHIDDVACAHDGTVQFQIANALTAVAIASAVGIDHATIASALSQFQSRPDILPGSFNVFTVGGYRVVIDTLAPSWHLRMLLRAVNPGNQRRQVTVVGDLEDLPSHDVREVGRLLGRHAGAIVLHSNKDARLVDEFRRGIAANDYPPIVIHLPTERRALNRALRTVRADDVTLILTNVDPGVAIRAVQRLDSMSSDDRTRGSD